MIGVEKMKENYIAADFRKTVAERFLAQAARLNAAFDARMQALRAENVGASREKKGHLERQIMPGIAAYEVLQTVMPKDEALQTVHGYVEQLAEKTHKYLSAVLRFPGLYRLVPGIFVKSTRTAFGPAAGFAAAELKTDKNTWRISQHHGRRQARPAAGKSARTEKGRRIRPARLHEAPDVRRHERFRGEAEGHGLCRCAVCKDR